MPTEDENQPNRRIIMRRGARFGAGSSTRTESLRAPREQEEDEIDHATDPESVHNDIIMRAPLYTPQQPPAQTAEPHDNTGGMPPDPRARMNQVAMAGSGAYAKEYRLSLLHRLLMRKVPLDQIADQLQVSISTVEKDRVELKKRLAETARQLDINEIIGNQTEMYNELSGMALRIGTNSKTPIPMQLAAIRTTLAAEADRTRFLNSAGVFDVLRFRKSEDGSAVSDVQLLMQSTADMMAQLLGDDSETVPEPRPRLRRPAKGFGKLTMEDTDASSGDTEEVEL